MTDPDAAVRTQLRTIEAATGRSVADWHRVVAESGMDRHSDILAFLKKEHGLTHGNANLLARMVRELDAGGPASAADLLDAQFAGGKARLRPIHDELLLLAHALGDDVTVAVKKTGVSLRRAKQFGLIEAPSAKRVELGLNLAQTPPTPRLRAVTGMCSHRVALSDVAEVDDEVAAWLRAAYARAG